MAWTSLRPAWGEGSLGGHQGGEGHQNTFSVVVLRSSRREFPGSPVVRTPSFHCRGHGFDPGRGTKIQ